MMEFQCWVMDQGAFELDLRLKKVDLPCGKSKDF